jgi:hypothetical protein
MIFMYKIRKNMYAWLLVHIRILSALQNITSKYYKFDVKPKNYNLLGSSQRMDATPPSQHIACNSWGTKSSMPSLVWKPWAPLKCKAFAWLNIQHRVWMEDRLERGGWPNCGRCKLCNHVQESASHLLFKCRFTIYVWTKVKQWLDLQDVDLSSWNARRTIK